MRLTRSSNWVMQGHSPSPASSVQVGRHVVRSSPASLVPESSSAESVWRPPWALALLLAPSSRSPPEPKPSEPNAPLSEFDPVCPPCPVNFNASPPQASPSQIISKNAEAAFILGMRAPGRLFGKRAMRAISFPDARYAQSASTPQALSPRSRRDLPLRRCSAALGSSARRTWRTDCRWR